MGNLSRENTHRERAQRTKTLEWIERANERGGERKRDNNQSENAGSPQHRGSGELRRHLTMRSIIGLLGLTFKIIYNRRMLLHPHLDEPRMPVCQPPSSQFRRHTSRKVLSDVCEEGDKSCFAFAEQKFRPARLVLTAGRRALGIESISFRRAFFTKARQALHSFINNSYLLLPAATSNKYSHANVGWGMMPL